MAVGKCEICGHDDFLGTIVLSIPAFLCSNCVKKAGGRLKIGRYSSLDEIREAHQQADVREIEEKDRQIAAKYYLEGVRGRKIFVYEDKVVLKVVASLGSFITGNISDGEKTIYYADCIGVQFKEEGPIQIGYLQFETAGSIMNNRTNNFFNENTFTWDTTKVSNEKMREVTEYVKQRIEAYKFQNRAASPVAPVDAVEEIKKYKELLDLEIITKEEFDAKKKQLLGL